MENHFYHIRCPPLNVTIFITHVRNCAMGPTPMSAGIYMCSVSFVIATLNELAALVIINGPVHDI